MVGCGTAHIRRCRGRAEEWRRLLGSEGDGLRQVFYCLNPERIIGAAGANGMARYALAKAARQRLPSDYGLADLWGMLRVLRTAQVSREMVLNFVAEHSLGLLRSY